MTDANPFEDPDVQAAAQSSAPQSYGDAAYDDASAPAGNNNNNNNANITAYIPDEAQRELVVNVGKTAATNATNAMQDDYNQSTATQEDMHEKPKTPDCCVKCWNWLPLRYFACWGGILLVVLPILDITFGTPNFVTFFIFLYLIVFGFLIIFVEAPTFKLTRWAQLKIYFWFRFLSRMWGRSWFYLFTSILCYAELANSSFSAAMFAGFYMTAIAILGFIFSRMAGKLHSRIYIFIAAGAELDESDELLGRFMRKFDELDMDNDGNIGSQELYKLAQQANRNITNTERQALQTFLDESCNGYVSKEDWMKQWVTYQDRMKFL